jgi:signal peptidase II
MKRLNKLIFFTFAILLFSTLNFYLSNIITASVSRGWHFSTKFLSIVCVENTGAAFSILQNSTKFLVVLSGIALIGIFYYILKNMENLFFKEFFFVSILISGILGNLYERVAFGFVRDFFDLTFINFPIFNISDIFINVGVIGIIILILLTKKEVI